MLIRDLFEQLSHTGSPCARRLLCCLLIGAFVQAPKLFADDPWPFWGRTPTRLGRTNTVGPKTPNISWRVQITFHNQGSILRSSATMDSAGRIFAGHLEGITAVDSRTREVLWDVRDQDGVQGTPAVWGGRVMWGEAGVGQSLYCYDAQSGQEIWRFKAPPQISVSPVVSQSGVVYFTDNDGGVHARRVADGSEVWTTRLRGLMLVSPSLDTDRLLLVTSESDVVGLDPANGDVKWTFSTSRLLVGVIPLLDDRLYVASTDNYLYCVNAVTGKEIWRFWGEKNNTGAVALGHDGTIYTGTAGEPPRFFAISPQGQELWRLEFGFTDTIPQAPIVAGDGTIYFCMPSYGPERGRIFALRPDGTILWVKLMPRHVWSSPMLAPDGTLYVLSRDQFLYAFRDLRGDLNCDGSVDLTDVEPFIMALLNPEQYQRWNPDCNAQLADLTEDGSIDLSDVEPFIECILGERCP